MKTCVLFLLYETSTSFECLCSIQAWNSRSVDVQKKSLWPGYSQASDGSKLEVGVVRCRPCLHQWWYLENTRQLFWIPPSSPCFSCNQCAQWRPCQDSGAVSPCSSPSNVPVTARPASGRMMLTASNPFLPLFTASHMFSCLRHLSRPWSVCSIPAYILTRKLHLPLKSMYKWYIL